MSVSTSASASEATGPTGGRLCYFADARNLTLLATQRLLALTLALALVPLLNSCISTQNQRRTGNFRCANLP